MNNMAKIFEIISCIEIFVNAIKIYQCMFTTKNNTRT